MTNKARVSIHKCDAQIEESDEMNLLGIDPDMNLSFNKHVEDIETISQKSKSEALSYNA